MKKHPIKALLMMLVFMLLIFSKKDVNAANLGISQNDILGTWEGHYTGNNGSTTIERKLNINIQTYNDKSSVGKFSGIASVDDNKNGNYYFEGTVEKNSNGKIVFKFKGKTWRNNPNNFGFPAFEGTFGSSRKLIVGTCDGDSDKTFDLEHKSTQVIKSEVPASQVAEYWTGEYDGYSGNVVVRRNLKMHKVSIQNGEIQGVMRFLPSSKADASYGATGRYYFKGTYDEKLATFKIQGYEWIEYPAGDSSVSNWTFVKLNGYIDTTTMTIIGSSENGMWGMRVSNAAEFETTPNYREDGTFTDKTGTYYTYITGTAAYKAPKSYTSTVTIPETITMYYQAYDVVSISNKAFANNNNIRKVDGGKNLKSIGDKAFYKAKNLSEVDFSTAQIKKIGKKAFYGCKSLKTIKVNGDALKKMSSQSFKGVKGSKVYIYAKNKKTYNKVVKAFKKSGIKKAKYKFVKH